MKRHPTMARFLPAALAAAAWVCACTATPTANKGSTAPARPHVLMVTGDDVGYAHDDVFLFRGNFPLA